MKKLDNESVDSWLNRNASQRKALQSMLNVLKSKELPEFEAEVNHDKSITTKNKIMNKITQFFKKLGILTMMLWLAGSLNLMAQNSDFVPGKVRIKIKPDKVELVVKDLNKASANGVLKTGLSSFDKISARYSASKMRRLFPHAGKNEEKHIKHGLHLWYEINVQTEANMEAVAREYGGNEYIITAEPIRQKSVNTSGVTLAENPAAPTMETVTNDPYLQDQWHLSNDASLEGSVAGSDINAPKAWDISMGTSNVIVAVVDGGVDTDHEDLKDNMWINTAELNGIPGEDDDFNGYIDDIYGYNFAENQGEITDQDHGTHVAGTVAATSNNGKGVAGVAGGSGNGDGVKIISAQVFSNNGSGSFAPAIVYGADNGAVISQNSWGYQSAGAFEQAVLDAIDYFIEEAGHYPGSPMKGGVVLFAAGNNGKDEIHYPSYYDQTIAIASTGTNYAKADYSNYGSWVDLTTTGGNVRQGSKSQVLSTLPDNRYGYMQGTSMATPHASGIAALVISKYGSETFTNEDLKKRLFTGVREIESYNPDFKGKLGLGFMDAYLALAPNDEQAPATISDLSLLGTSEDFATLNFTVPTDAGDLTPYAYRLMWSKNTDMSEASEMTIKNDFREVGDLIETTVEDLDFETTYYFSIVAIDRWENASAMSNVVEATTNQGPDIATDLANLNFEIDTQVDTNALDTIKILNKQSGILNWNAETRQVSNSPSYTSAALPARGTTINPSQLTVKKEPVELIQKFETRGAVQNSWEASEKKFFGSNPIYIIGEIDTTATNSSATRFTVEEPDGFNLTSVKAYLNLDQEDGPAVLEIYKGEEIKEDNLIYSDDQFRGRDENDSRFHTNSLNEQLFFEQGETFWIVIHVPAGNLYPLGVGPELSPEHSDKALMSFDLGETWVPLAGAMDNDQFVWAVTALSQIEPLYKYVNLTPNEGQILGEGELDMEVAVDASQLINGNYKSNIVINSNDSDTPIHRVPAEVKVTGHKPVLSTNNILDFGSVFNGLSSTKEMTIQNTGLGRFRTQSITSSSPNFVVNTSVWSLNVAAKNEASMSITYTPSGVGNENAEITLTSYNGDVHTFNVFGVGTEPAQIEADPAVVNFSDLSVGENAQASITLKNTGKYPLQYGFPAFADDVSHIENLPENVQRFPYVMEKMPYDGYEFNDISTSGTEVTEFFITNSFSEFFEVDLGFDFPYFGNSVNSLYITKRGMLTLGEDGNFNTSSQFHGKHMPEGYISALNREWAVAKGGSIHYLREQGKFILQYSNVRHANDRDNVAITFQIELYNNGDIKFIYDKFEGLFSYQLRTFYAAIENQSKNDGIIVNSSSDNVLLPMQPGQIVHIHSPGLGLIGKVEEAKGMIQPGDSKEITISLDGEKLIEGTHKEYISVLSNDPFNSSFPIEVNINVVDGGESKLVLSETEVDFGEVFQTSEVRGIIGVKNDGSKQISIDDISFTNGQLNYDGETSMVIEPNQTLYVEYTLNTADRGPVNDTLVITDAADETYEVSFKGTIVKAPGIEVVETAYSEMMNSDEELVKAFKVTNTGESTLEYAIAASEHVTVQEPAAQNNVPEFTYVHRSTYDETMKPNAQWIKLEEEDKVQFYLSEGDNWEVLDLPFEFEFYQEKYGKIWMGTQGILSFDEIEDESSSYFTPPNVPQDDELNNFIAPYFAAGGPNTSLPEDQWGRYMKAFEDKVVFEWRGYNNLFYIGSEFSIQAILYKNGKIKFQYKHDPNLPIRAFYGLIGIESKNGADGTQIAYYQDYLANGVAVEFSPAVKETLEAGESREYDLTFNTMGTNAGTYEESLKVINNTPLTPEVTVPIDLEVAGEAKLVFIPDTLDLGEKMVRPDAAYLADVAFKNTGKKTFTVHNLRTEDGSTAQLDQLIYNIRWGWQWVPVRPTDEFTIEPGFESETFRLTVSPDGPDSDYTNKVLVDTDYGTTEEMLVKADFKLPPTFTVNSEEIYHLAFNDDVYTHTLNLGNAEGQSPLVYTIGMNYLRSDVMPAAAPQDSDSDAILLRHDLDFEPNNLITQLDEEFATVLNHDNKDNPWTSVGFNGTSEFTSSTRFVAPETGFNLSHIQTWYAWGEWLESDLKVEIRVGDNIENADVLYKETLSYVAEEENGDGELITLDLGETVELNPYEKFYVVITYPLGAGFPQGVAYVDAHQSNRFKYYSGGFWWDIDGAGLADSGWMVRAAEVEVAEKNWLSITGEANGDIPAGGSLDTNIELHPARATQPNNYAMLTIESNDPDREFVSIPVTLDINQAPDLVVDDMYYVNENETLNISLSTSDLEGDVVAGARMAESNPKTEINFAEGMVDFSFSPDFEDAGFHTFDVILEDENGIEGTSTIKVEVIDVNRAPEANLIADQTLNLYTGQYRLDLNSVFIDPDGDQVTTLTPTASNGVVEIFVNDNNMLVSPSALGTSTITLQGVDGRGGEITTTFDVLVVNKVTKDSDLEESWKVHPNPVNEVMYIKMYSPVMEKMSIKFYNTLGALVKTSQSEGSDSMIEVPVANLSPEIYFVEITTENARSVKKIVKN
ncbi:S8 family serine peptidase [Gramella lutea]|uniref:S8 family serine peptidase n=1 Tax=Christiangramia lutea TaxID=1607951 RepID=A0A9X2AA23_9FLAO|nr:S8 family serine peptidase [Christiangramia lutea]MCH4822746.1 S8 family serine peptidase [Christiangramia lutea]